jgi:late competence protein required for DNA uptake (superfamily II DNA/RNA helicase)
MCLAHFFKPGTIPSSTNHDCVRGTHFSIMISSATHSQQLISVVVFIVVLWLLFIEQCYSPHQSCSIINMQRLSFLGLFRLLRSIMTIHFVSVIKHYIPFNYIHHTQHLFKSPRSVCHGVLLMARAIQARTLLSTSTYERGSTFPNVNPCTFWQHQHLFQYPVFHVRMVIALSLCNF